jgi:hypothetical protein
MFLPDPELTIMRVMSLKEEMMKQEKGRKNENKGQ